MKDIQNLHDSRRIDIRKVGVKHIAYPIMVLDKASATQQTVARVNMYVNLPHRFKGTHMSRFVEILNRFHGAFNLKTFHLILEEMKLRLDAEAAHLEIDFPYFFQAEQAGRPGSMVRYDCRLHGSLARELDLVVEVDVPVSLPTQINPPAATAFSGIWGVVTVAVRMKSFLWIEDLIALVEQGGALPGQGQTVESLCRRVSAALQGRQAFDWYKVVVKNIASGYSAFASVEWPEPPGDCADSVVGPPVVA